MTRAERIEALFAAALEQPPDRREAFVEQRTAAPDERAELLSLLRSQRRLEDGDGFLARPAARLDPGTVDDLLAAGDAPDSFPVIDGFELLEVLGRGGMGVVYRARQLQPRRLVALKVIDPRLAGPTSLRRFAREAEALGRLEHPGIARLYQTGQAGGPWFAMELVEGLPLLDYARTRRLGRRARLELLARIADAVHHAHGRGIVHRDLKPANVLVVDDPSSSASDAPRDPIGAWPKVLDFGVARWRGATDVEVSQYTEPGRIVGTLSCMSPEQCRSGEAVDARTDVYALGVLAFELLAGARPYELSGRSIADAMRVIQDDEPTRLGSLDASLRGDVETIVARALEKEPARRYADAAAFAADLRRHLRDEPIVARPPSPLDRARKFCRRHRALVTAAALVAAVLLAALLAVGREARRARGERDAALAAQADQRAALSLLEDLLLTASPYEFAGPGEATVREVLERAAKRTEFFDGLRPRVRARVAATLGKVFFGLRRFESAARWYDDAVRVATEVDGPAAADTVTAAASLARALALSEQPRLARQVLDDRVRPFLDAQTSREPQRLAEIAEVTIALHGRNVDVAIDRARRLVDDDRAAFGERHGSTQESTTLLMRALLDGEQFDTALDLAERQYEQRRRDHGDDHPLTVSAHAMVLTARLGTGREPDAAAVARELRQVAGDLGPHFPDSAVHLTVAAQALRVAGRFDEASAAIDAAVAAASSVHGADARGTISARNSRAVLWLDLGDRRALAELEELHALCTAHWPESFLATGVAANLARARQESGDLEGSLELHRRVVADYTRDAGPHHRHTLAARNNLASALLGLGRADEALAILEDTYAILCATHGAEHRESMTAGNNLAVAHKRLGHYEQAERLFAQLARHADKLYAADHPMRAVSRLTWAICLQEMGRDAQAEPLLREALATFDRVMPRGHRFRIRSLEALLAVTEKAGDARALSELRQRLEAERRH